MKQPEHKRHHDTNDSAYANVSLADIDVRYEGDVIISALHDDIYFNRTNGLQESDYVFCKGTDLASAIAGSSHITIAETGFGTGLNLLAACQLRDEINPACQIDFISFEACPLTAEIITKAHRPYQEIAHSSALLCANLPPRWPGYHKVIMDEGRTHLHLYYGDALSQIAVLDFVADIWFLDGFNPKTNHDLWSQALFEQIFRCSADGARLATFTAAGSVKRGLAQAGFCVSRRDGFGHKRDMIIAHKRGEWRANEQEISSAIIIGGGIAGASLAYALHHRGVSAHIIEKGAELASGASGNGAAMQSARLRVHNDAAGRLSVACLSYAKRLAAKAHVIAHEGAVTLNNRDKDQKRLDKLAKAGWPEALFQSLDAQELSNILGIQTQQNGEWQQASAVIYPAELTRYLAQSAQVTRGTEVRSIHKTKAGYEVMLADGEMLSCGVAFLACGADIPALLARSNLPEMACQISAGQVSVWEEAGPLSISRRAVNYGGYMTPQIDGKQYFGASFNRDGQTHVTAEGHQHNLDLLPEEWRALAPDITKAEGRLSYRLSTKDRMPVCGALDDRLYLISALGARGMTNGPLLADMLVAQALGRPTGLDRDITQAVGAHHVMALPLKA